MRSEWLLLSASAVVGALALTGVLQARQSVERAAVDAWQRAQFEAVEAVGARLSADHAMGRWPPGKDHLIEDWAWVVDDQGQIGGHADASQIGTSPFDPATDAPALTAMLEAMHRGERGTARYPWVVPETGHVQWRLAAYVPLPEAGWAVATSSNREVALVGVGAALDALLLASAGLGMALLLAGAAVARQQRRGRARETEALRERLALAQAAAHSERLAQIGGAIASVTHDLRSPLAAVQLIGESLEEELEDPEHREMARQLCEISRQITRLTHDVTHYARRDACGEGCDPSEAAELARRLCPASQQEGRTLQLHVAGLPKVAMDRDRLVQVLINLLSNAAHYGQRLEVGGAHHGRLVSLWVDDDGPGVPPQERERVFSRFETGRTDGTGLGLFLSRQLVEAAGGTLSVSDGARGGARFVAELPAAPAA